MIVRAKSPGAYQCMRSAGDVFEIPDELFSPVWMEKVVEPETQDEKDKREWLENEKKASDEAKGE